MQYNSNRWQQNAIEHLLLAEAEMVLRPLRDDDRDIEGVAENEPLPEAVGLPLPLAVRVAVAPSVLPRVALALQLALQVSVPLWLPLRAALRLCEWLRDHEADTVGDHPAVGEAVAVRLEEMLPVSDCPADCDNDRDTVPVGDGLPRGERLTVTLQECVRTWVKLLLPEELRLEAWLCDPLVLPVPVGATVPDRERVQDRDGVAVGESDTEGGDWLRVRLGASVRTADSVWDFVVVGVDVEE